MQATINIDTAAVAPRSSPVAAAGGQLAGNDFGDFTAFHDATAPRGARQDDPAGGGATADRTGRAASQPATATGALPAEALRGDPLPGKASEPATAPTSDEIETPRGNLISVNANAMVPVAAAVPDQVEPTQAGARAFGDPPSATRGQPRAPREVPATEPVAEPAASDAGDADAALSVPAAPAVPAVPGMTADAVRNGLAPPVGAVTTSTQPAVVEARETAAGDAAHRSGTGGGPEGTPQRLAPEARVAAANGAGTPETAAANAPKLEPGSAVTAHHGLESSGGAARPGPRGSQARGDAANPSMVPTQAGAAGPPVDAVTTVAVGRDAAPAPGSRTAAAVAGLSVSQAATGASSSAEPTTHAVRDRPAGATPASEMPGTIASARSAVTTRMQGLDRSLDQAPQAGDSARMGKATAGAGARGAPWGQAADPAVEPPVASQPATTAAPNASRTEFPGAREPVAAGTGEPAADARIPGATRGEAPTAGPAGGSGVSAAYPADAARAPGTAVAEPRRAQPGAGTDASPARQPVTATVKPTPPRVPGEAAPRPPAEAVPRTAAFDPVEPGPGGAEALAPAAGPAPAASGPAAGPAAPVAPDAARHIAQQIAAMSQPLPDAPVEIALDPQELGRVKMVLSGSDSSIAVTLTVERPETAALMRRHIEMLASEFRAMGYSNVSVEFAGGDGLASGSGGGSAREHDAQPAEPATGTDSGRRDGDVAGPDDLTAPHTRQATGRLDLRL